jgi:hypothetical protein
LLRISLILLLALISTGRAGAESGDAAQVLSLVNQARVNVGLPPLAVNPLLTSAAQAHADDMARNGVTIGHNGSDGSTPERRILAAGYHGYSWGPIVGENWAAYRTVDESMSAWMSDQPHRGNILRPGFREIGVGVARSSSSGAPILVADFGAQPNVLPVFLSASGSGATLTLANEVAAPGGDGPNVVGRAVTVEISTDASFSQKVSQPYATSIQYSFPDGRPASTVYVKFHDASGRTTVSSAIASEIVISAASVRGSFPTSAPSRKPAPSQRAAATRTAIPPSRTATLAPTEDLTPRRVEIASSAETPRPTPTAGQTLIVRRPLNTPVYVGSFSAATAEFPLVPNLAILSFAASCLLFVLASVTALRTRRR